MTGSETKVHLHHASLDTGGTLTPSTPGDDSTAFWKEGASTVGNWDICLLPAQ